MVSFCTPRREPSKTHMAVRHQLKVRLTGGRGCLTPVKLTDSQGKADCTQVHDRMPVFLTPECASPCRSVLPVGRPRFPLEGRMRKDFALKSLVCCNFQQRNPDASIVCIVCCQDGLNHSQACDHQRGPKRSKGAVQLRSHHVQSRGVCPRHDIVVHHHANRQLDSIRH